MQLYIARLLKGYTQIELMLATGIDQSRLSRIENGYIKATKMEIKKITDVLGIHRKELEFNKRELRQQWTAGGK